MADRDSIRGRLLLSAGNPATGTRLNTYDQDVADVVVAGYKDLEKADHRDLLTSEMSSHVGVRMREIRGDVNDDMIAAAAWKSKWELEYLEESGSSRESV